MTKQKAGTPEIKLIKTVDLIPYVMNSRTHSPDQVSQIAASIKEFGFTNPVLTDGSNGIIAGHGRVMAAQKLGVDEVPVIELSYLSEAQRKAYIIADNKLALNAGWDWDILKSEIIELQSMDIDLGLIGFTAEELDKIILPFEDEKQKPDIPPDKTRHTLIVSDDDERRIESLFEELRDREYDVKVME